MIRIGLLIHDVDSEYSRELIDGIASFCKQHNLMFYVFPARSKNWPYGNFEYQHHAIASHVSANNLDGLVVATGTQSHYVTREELFEYFESFKPLPTVSVGYQIPGIANIIVDCTDAFGAAIRHLIQKHGRRRIALITTFGESSESAERNEVYYKVLQSENIPIDRSIIFSGDFVYSLSHSCLETYYREHNGLDFDAIVAINDDMAFGALDFCLEHKISVPNDIAILGFDDIQKAAFSHPTLSSMNQVIAEQGEKAVATLLKIIAHEQVESLQVVHTRAVFRQSCGCVPVTEMTVSSIDQDGNEIHRGDLVQGVGEWYIWREQLNKIMVYRLDMQTSLTIEQLRRQINADIAMFDITSATICLFVEPVTTEKFTDFVMPDKAYVFSSFDQTIRYDFDSGMPYVYFNPRISMLPEEFWPTSSSKMYIMPIFQRAIQYGYIVFRPGNFDNQLYGILSSILTDIVVASLSYSKSLEEKEHLTEQNVSLSEYNKKLSLISRTDEMTQLLNRRGFLALGQQTLNIANDMHQTGLVIYGDMDGLKKINDTYGHDAGDRAIKAEAEILRSVFRASDIIGRMGGDEFAIISVGMTTSVFDRIYERLTKFCEQWNNTTNEAFTLSISLGYAHFSLEEYSLQALLTEADMNQYEEKRRKKMQRN